LATVSIKSPGFKEKHGYSDEDVKAVEANLLQQVTEMIAFTEHSGGNEWDYILKYFGEVKPSYWQRHGIEILDRALAIVAVLLVVFGLLAATSLLLNVRHFLSL